MPRLLFLLLLAVTAIAQDPRPFAERNGLLVVEAEQFHRQELVEIRRWTLQRGGVPAASASGGEYLQVLPDTRRTHDDKLIRGENFSPEPGRMAVLHYDVQFTKAGRYFVWVRAYSSGTEDNGVHVGLNGAWPESGQRIQLCEGKNRWYWESAQRTEANHCGEPGKIYLDVPAPGRHTVSFSMREDGFALDRFLLTTDAAFRRPEDAGPAASGRGVFRAVGGK